MAIIDQTILSLQHEQEEKRTQEAAKRLNLPYINLVGYPVAPEVLRIIPEETARGYAMISYLKSGKTLKVAATQPLASAAMKVISTLKQAASLQVIVALCSNTSLRYALQLYKTLSTTEILTEPLKVTKDKEKAFEQEIKNLVDLKDKIKKISTTKILDVLFAGAVKTEASDIHLEPYKTSFRIRFRVDGVLQDVAEFPVETYHPLIARVKYLSHLKLDVTQTPQDGRFELSVLGESLDIRVASLPTSYGEALELRLLTSSLKALSLEDLGFVPEHLKLIEEAIHRPQGMILTTGPTGSGKTTTLYATLKKLNKSGVKIITLEDPVEYRIEGVDQVQINPDMNFDFAAALKGSLRQDPDIIMVGEIRDLDTAEIGIRAAMTGHLVLSTLHTNSAPAALVRLVDIGVKPYLLAGSINLIIAQRLVRRFCKNCQGKGCEICNKTGLKGRIAIAEIIKPGKEIEDLLVKEATLREITEKAKQLGMKTMEADGLSKVAQGLTTKEEVWRVTKE